MDARPCRPHGAENVVPRHQRHKSTGNIAAMSTASAAGFRGPARRAAFVDVTNMTKNGGSFRDEPKVAKPPSALPSHHAQPPAVVNKENVPCSGRDSFTRPAHRLAALASKPKSSADPRSSDTARKPPTTILHESSSYLNIGAELAFSRQTAALELERDSSLGPASQPSTSAEGLPLQPRHHKSQPQLKPQQPTLRRTQSKQFEKTDPAPGPAARVNPPKTGITTRPSDYSDAYAAYPIPIYPIADQALVDVSYGEDYLDLLQKLPDISEQTQNAALAHGGGQMSTLSEPEECWDEEDDEDYDDQDQAYTTGHSFRSRDLTTGGATTLLAPRVTVRVQRELEEARLEVQKNRTLNHVEDELWDVSMVAEYGEEIFEYMRELEIKMLPNPHYMEIQTEIQWSMRSVLMDWLVQVHNRFSLLPETLFLTVNYIDRFLSCKIVSIGKLQLVGATAILVASKYEEINCPSLDEIIFMVDGGYSMEEILKAERFMLSMLSFELGWPGPMSFLRRVSKADDYDLDTRTLAKYFLELTIMDERFVASPPSFLAAGAHCLSRLVLNKGDWTKQHVHYSGYTWSQLRPLVSMMIECCEHPRLHHAAVYEKYRDRRFKEASTIVQRALDAGFTLPHHTVPIRSVLQTQSASADTMSNQMQYNNSLLVSTEG